MATARSAEERAVIRVAGDGARDFLHDLVTTDVVGLAAGAARYGALLTPQGKYLADFVMIG
ncbi:MAG: folate-binding Fe-S cluster repair protein YgfZ, partial [Paracoccaceae bacterium]